MRKGKRRGFDLVRNEVKEERQTKRGSNSQEVEGEFARIRTRKAMRGEDGSIISLAPQAIPVWLVQLEPIFQILLADQLEEQGYKASSFGQLHTLPNELEQSESPPRLVVVSAQAVSQQTPFFRKIVMPTLERTGTQCLLVGLNERQEQFYRAWYTGHSVTEGSPEDVIRRVKQVIGAGLRR